jgi:hypothetical protein
MYEIKLTGEVQRPVGKDVNVLRPVNPLFIVLERHGR